MSVRFVQRHDRVQPQALDVHASRRQDEAIHENRFPTLPLLQSPPHHPLEQADTPRPTGVKHAIDRKRRTLQGRVGKVSQQLQQRLNQRDIVRAVRATRSNCLIYIEIVDHRSAAIIRPKLGLDVRHP
jgi:hypothetical protein